MKDRNLTCIVCPRGCALTVSFDENGSIKSISGNLCPRGKAYAENECVHPVRTITSTVRCLDGEMIPVKTSSPIPKELMFEVMKEINSVRAADDIRIGDAVIKDVLGTGADIIATRSHE